MTNIYLKIEQNASHQVTVDNSAAHVLTVCRRRHSNIVKRTRSPLRPFLALKVANTVHLAAFTFKKEKENLLQIFLPRKKLSLAPSRLSLL